MIIIPRRCSADVNKGMARRVYVAAKEDRKQKLQETVATPSPLSHY